MIERIDAMKRVANWWRSRRDKPVLFDFARAMQQAQGEADDELRKLDDPVVVAELASWEHQVDLDTDELSC